MLITYSGGSEATEIVVYTYEEWLKEYNRRETKRRIKQRIEHLYYMRQRLLGAIAIFVGIVMPFISDDNDATFSLVALPLGIFLITTWEKIVAF